MIASVDFWSSFEFNDVFEDTLTGEEIVDSPPIVSGSSVMEVGPIGVAVLLFWM